MIALRRYLGMYHFGSKTWLWADDREGLEVKCRVRD